MGKLTHTVSGSIASFKSPDKSLIESLKIHFSPVQEGTGDPSPTNVRSITGWTGFNGYHGKNIYNMEDNTLDVYINSAGRITENEQWQITDYISVSGHESVVYCGITTPGTAPYSAWYNSEKQLISTFKQQTGQNTLSIPSGAAYVRFSILRHPTIHVDDVSGFMLFYADELRAFHDSWSDDYGTVYGGYVDLITGDVVATYFRLNVSDITFTSTSSYSGGFGFGKERVTGTPVYSNIFTMKPNTTTNINQLGLTEILYHPNSTGNYKNLFYAYNPEYTDISDFSNWFKETYSDGYFIYVLETPIVVAALTPTELRSFLGVNNIWSDANGDIECTYSFQDHLTKKRRTLMNDHKVTTTAAPIANFKSRIKGGLLNSCIVNFSPVQSGTGDPSPTNIRPINGWTGFNLNQNGSNLLNPSLWPSPINGHYIKCETGSNPYWSPGAYNASDFVPVKGGAQYTLHASFTGQNADENKSGIAFYTTNNVSGYISGIYMDITLGTTYTFTTPENAKYMRFCNHIDCVPNDEVWLVAGSVLGTQETYVGSTTAITLPDVPMGKNFFNISTLISGKSVDSSGNLATNSSRSTSEKIYLQAGTYTVSRKTPSGEYWKLYKYNLNGEIITGAAFDNAVSKNTFTINSDCYVRLSFDYIATSEDETQLELGSEKSAYEPYTNEFYGGYVDILKGTIVQTYKRVNLGDYTWGKISKLSSDVHNKYFYAASGNLTSSNNKYDIPTDSYCSAFPFIARHDMYMVDNTRGIAFDNGAMYISWADMDDYTVSEFKEAVVGYYLVAPLVTPIIYQLTPTQLKTLLGTNNIWADTNGDISVTYWTK